MGILGEMRLKNEDIWDKMGVTPVVGQDEGCETEMV